MGSGRRKKPKKKIEYLTKLESLKLTIEEQRVEDDRPERRRGFGDFGAFSPSLGKEELAEITQAGLRRSSRRRPSLVSMDETTAFKKEVQLMRKRLEKDAAGKEDYPY